MRSPTDFELSQFMHVYDPTYAREYYLRTRKLTGRDKTALEKPASTRNSSSLKNLTTGSLIKDQKTKSVNTRGQDPRTGKTIDQIQKEARLKQRKELGEQVDLLEKNLKKIDIRIQQLIREEKVENREGKAKKERAAKEIEKPKTVAEKAEASRENEKYRDKNQQKLKNNADDSKSGEGSSKSGKLDTKATVSDLKALATKVRGKIAVAKQKLAAL